MSLFTDNTTTTGGSDIISHRYYNQAIWRYQYVRNLDNQLRYMMQNVFTELKSRLLICNNDEDNANGWKRGILDMQEWNTQDIEEDIELLKQRSVHIEKYFQQTFETYILESTLNLKNVHLDNTCPSFYFFIRAYLTSVCRMDVFSEYMLFIHQTHTDLKFAYREVMELALEICANHHLHVHNIPNNKAEDVLN